MRKSTYFILLLVLLMLTACNPEDANVEKENKSTEASIPTSIPPFSEGSIEPGQQLAFSIISNSGQEMDYLLYMPIDYDETKTWPLLVFLHGYSNSRNIETVRNKNPLAWIDTGVDFPFFLISPQSQSGLWPKYFEPMDELIEKLHGILSIDSDAIFLSGASAGGYGAWRYAFANPDLFAAVAPVAGGTTTVASDPIPATICLLKDIPVWAAHSEDDELVPIEMNIDAVRALEECGSTSIRFTTYTDLSHVDSIYTAYAGPDIYDWMTDQIDKK